MIFTVVYLFVCLFIYFPFMNRRTFYVYFYRNFTIVRRYIYSIPEHIPFVHNHK